MSLATIALVFFVLLIVSYRLYGGLLSRIIGVNDTIKTPAHGKKDGVDFVPTHPFWLFPQHFSAIAAAGPIAGPIIACMMWGYVPCLLWIGVGVVFFGAMHDFLSLAISVRHGASSIATIAKQHLSKRSSLLLMTFICLALIYVILSFTEITASTFTGHIEELAVNKVSFNPGGAVALSAVLYLAISMALGVVTRLYQPKTWLTTLIFVPSTFLCIWVSTHFSHLLVLNLKTWCMLILAYCFLASLAPVWLLLQPRGYLGGFVLYSALGIGAYGLLFGGFPIQQASFKFLDESLTASLFPFLFVTIACGACSGFHGLVCSGTTAKQIDKESHIRPVGYGAMLGEALMAIIALSTIMIWSEQQILGLSPGAIYGKGIGEFLTLLVGAENRAFAITFGAMAFSTFVFDTLDVATRLGRYLVQELFGLHQRYGAILATALVLLLPILFLINANSGSYTQFWALFGASNQLLAALTLLVITVWLRQEGRPIVYTFIPMLFLFSIALSALFIMILDNLILHHNGPINTINGLISTGLILLSLFLLKDALFKMSLQAQAPSQN